MSAIRLKQKARYAIADKMKEPLKNNFQLEFISNYRQWTLKVINLMKKMRTTAEKKDVFLTSDGELTEEQKKAINECHVIWFQKKPVVVKIYQAYSSYIKVLDKTHSKDREYSAKEIEIIYLLSELLIFQFERALGLMSSIRITSEVDRLEKMGALTSEEAKQIKIEVLKRDIMPLLKIRIKDEAVIQSILRLVTTPEKGNKLLGYLRYESNVTPTDVYRVIK